ncbi:MAG: hypothetical protein LIO90_06310 [Bacteroidales bacterium]|nr:hypothetical protein [Bacteroidales bacterium]
MQGLDKFREYLGGYNGHYVIIGGTSLNLNLAEEGQKERATKDIDMIVVCEAITKEYLVSFWQFIKAGGYTPSAVKTAEGIKRTYYRFDNPTDPSFPVYIELFARQPDSIDLPADVHLVHISKEEYLSSFSAILIDDDYYNYAVQHSIEIQGVQTLDCFGLIALKAKAFVSNLERKLSGGSVQQNDIDKHKRDIYRLLYILRDTDVADAPMTIKNDLRRFISLVQQHPVSTKALAKAMEVAGNELSMSDLADILTKTFGL